MVNGTILSFPTLAPEFRQSILLNSRIIQMSIADIRFRGKLI